MKKTPSSICEATQGVFRINGKDTFLYSGEMHYFRIPQRYWERHLQALLDAGCNAVSTYVPWSWHEYEEGQFDLTGKTHPERDLVSFLNLAKKMDLFVTLKPGPYIMAETTDQGIPRWLTNNYPETKCRTAKGQEWGPDFINIAHPIFRAKAERWLKLFAKQIVKPRQHLEQGAVIMLQLDNEIGIFQWLGSAGDYSENNVRQWKAYLKERFKDPLELEKLIDRPVTSFEAIEPPSELCDSRRDFVLYRIWHDYHRTMYSEYVGFLKNIFIQEGVDTPFFVNIGGWVYGRAHEFPLNATFHRYSCKDNPEVFYGVDHIPEFVSALNTHDGIVATQLANEIQRGQFPLYSAELQCGSREHGVQPYPTELSLFYRQCMIHGLTGMNFYMFAQGKNPKGRGIDGPMFYWFNAVDYKGKRQEIFDTIQDLGEWLKFNGDQLVHSSDKADLAIGFYPHLYETEFLTPKLQKRTNIDHEKLGIMDPVNFRDNALFDGVIRILVKDNIPYDMADLTLRPVKNLLQYKTLVLLSNEMMDAETQTKLCEFVKKGGKLVLFPTVPVYDLDFQPCRILADFLGITFKGLSKGNRVYMDKLKDIPIFWKSRVIECPDAKVLTRTADKEVVGIEKQYGKGTVRFFGFHLNYTIEEHPDLWAAMMQFNELPQTVQCRDNSLQIHTRFADREGFLFVGNIHRSAKKDQVAVRLPGSRSLTDLGTIEMEALSGMLLPLNVELLPKTTLLFAHAELLDRKVCREEIALTLKGQPAAKGIAVFKGKLPIKQALLDGTPVQFETKGNLTTFRYNQTGKQQVLQLILA